ncbi:hypothetical protein L1887_38458 [Cichorium endivia]|nr:hypothetical protein L1887_38458 [Cichorium endivia]
MGERKGHKTNKLLWSKSSKKKWACGASKRGAVLGISAAVDGGGSAGGGGFGGRLQGHLRHLNEKGFYCCLISREWFLVAVIGGGGGGMLRWLLRCLRLRKSLHFGGARLLVTMLGRFYWQRWTAAVVVDGGDIGGDGSI